jgi:hypothetical protein
MVEAPTLSGISISTLAVVAGTLLVITISDLLLRWLVRRQVRRDQAAAVQSPEHRRKLLAWIDALLKAAVAPLSTLLWIVGALAEP